MFFSYKKNKISYRLITIFLISIFISTNIVTAKPLPTEDTVLQGYTQRLITNSQSIIDVLKLINADTVKLVTNTQKILDNAIKIAAILSGTLPGAQADNLAAQENLPEVKVALRQMTNEIITFANKGMDGDPAFITNTGLYLKNIEDVTINNFILNNPALDSAGQADSIKLAIGNQYQPFEKRITPTMTDTAKVDKFTRGDFIGGGGWDAWLEINSVPQNNMMGSIMLAQNELDTRIEASTHAAELEANWGNGFMSWKVCVEANADPDRNFDGCIIQTPGSSIANKLNWADTVTLRELEMATDFNSISYILSRKLPEYTKIGSLSSGGVLSGRTITPDLTETIRDRETWISDYLATLPPPGPVTGSNPYYNADGTINHYYNPDGSPSGNPAYRPDGSVDRTALLKVITDMLVIENQVLPLQTNIYNMLDATEKALTAATCVNSVKDKAISQISESAPYEKIVPNLQWNKKDTGTVVTNISILSSIKEAIDLNKSDGEITILLESAAGRPFNVTGNITYFAAPDGGGYLYVKGWLQNIVTYLTPLCSIDKSSLTAWGII